MSIRIVSALLATCIMFSFTACNTNSQKDDRIEVNTRATKSGDDNYIDEPNQSIDITLGTTRETTETTTESTPETTPTPTPTPTPVPIGKTTVTAAKKKKYSNDFGSGTSRIPKVTIEGVDTSAINKEISKFCNEFYKYDVVEYSYYIGKTYVSIFISIGFNDGGGTEKVYNISRRTGKKMSRAEMLKELGISSKKFNSRVKKAIKKYLKGDLKPSSKAYKKAISNKTLNKTTPYSDSKGKLCYITSIADPLDGYGSEHLYGRC